MVPPRDPQLGIDFHGRPDVSPFGTDFSLWSLQIPARIDLGERLRPILVHAGHGIHRADPALRSGRVLGIGHRRIHHGTSSVLWRSTGSPDAGRRDHRRTDTLAV